MSHDNKIGMNDLCHCLTKFGSSWHWEWCCFSYNLEHMELVILTNSFKTYFQNLSTMVMIDSLFTTCFALGVLKPSKDTT